MFLYRFWWVLYSLFTQIPLVYDSCTVLWSSTYHMYMYEILMWKEILWISFKLYLILYYYYWKKGPTRIKLLYNYILGINYQIELVQYWKFLFSVRQTKGKIFFTCISKCWFAMYIVVIYPSEFNRRSYVWNKSGKRNYSNQTPGSDREGDW